MGTTETDKQAGPEIGRRPEFGPGDQVGGRLDPVELALICQRAENQFVGMNCGILDQYTASVGLVGQALLLDCRALTSQHAALRAKQSRKNLSTGRADSSLSREPTT